MIGIGSRVICVDNVERTSKDMAYPVKGCVYTIRGINTDEDLDGDTSPAYYLEEVVNREFLCGPYQNGTYKRIEPCFYHWHFRPVKETDIEVFRQILVDVDKYDMVEW